MGEAENIEYNRDKGVSVTVYFGQQKGHASSSDLSQQALKDTVEAACNIAKYTAKDEFCGLADANLMATETPDLDLYHPWNISVEAAIEIAKTCEAAAMDVVSLIAKALVFLIVKACLPTPIATALLVATLARSIALVVRLSQKTAMLCSAIIGTPMLEI